MRYRGLESTLNLAGSPPGDKRSVEARAAAAILAAHEGWRQGFEEITGRARERFERRDWRGAQADATARLALYRIHLDNAVADVRDLLDDALMERTLWAALKAHHARALAHRGDAEIAQTFFNSVTRRVFSTVGVAAAIEYLDPDASDPTDPLGPHRCRRRANRALRARGPRRGGASPAAPELPVVGAVGPGGARRRAGGRPDPATPGRDRAGRTDCHRDASPGVLPEQGRLSGRTDPGRRRGPPAGAAADPRRAGDRGRCCPDDPERGQRRLRLQLDLLPGGRALSPGAGRVPQLDHAQQAPG